MPTQSLKALAISSMNISASINDCEDRGKKFEARLIYRGERIYDLSRVPKLDQLPIKCSFLAQYKEQR